MRNIKHRLNITDTTSTTENSCTSLGNSTIQTNE